MASRIPIKAAERISEQYDCPMVVMFALNENAERFHVVTYGKTKALCRHAASIGEQIAQKVLAGDIAPVADEPLNLPNTPTVWEGFKPL